MRNNGFETNVINLKKKRLIRKYKALFSLLTRVKMIFNHKVKKPDVGKYYKKTINH
jgi:alpha-ketoglutarate-dependent taurine dioxygenase